MSMSPKFQWSACILPADGYMKFCHQVSCQSHRGSIVFAYIKIYTLHYFLPCMALLLQPRATYYWITSWGKCPKLSQFFSSKVWNTETLRNVICMREIKHVSMWTKLVKKKLKMKENNVCSAKKECLIANSVFCCYLTWYLVHLL